MRGREQYSRTVKRTQVPGLIVDQVVGINDCFVPAKDEMARGNKRENTFAVRRWVHVAWYGLDSELHPWPLVFRI